MQYTPQSLRFIHRGKRSRFTTPDGRYETRPMRGDKSGFQYWYDTQDTFLTGFIGSVATQYIFATPEGREDAAAKLNRILSGF